MKICLPMFQQMIHVTCTDIDVIDQPSANNWILDYVIFLEIFFSFKTSYTTFVNPNDFVTADTCDHFWKSDLRKTISIFMRWMNVWLNVNRNSRWGIIDFLIILNKKIGPLFLLEKWDFFVSSTNQFLIKNNWTNETERELINFNEWNIDENKM